MRSTAYLLLFIMIVTIVIIDVLSKNKRMLNNIKNEYNNSISYTKVNFEDARDYYKRNENDSYIDDITWHDLNFDDVYKKMCNLQSFIGINVLYKLLRQPVNSQKELKSRENIINYFQSSEDNRVKIQYTLRKMLNRNQNICSRIISSPTRKRCYKFY